MIWNAIICSILVSEFQAANRLYDAGQSAEAAAAYERIEPKTSHVYFNLGNALFRQDAFGLAEQFVGLDNFIKLFAEPDYASAFGLTLLFAVATTALSMGFAYSTSRPRSPVRTVLACSPISAPRSSKSSPPKAT